MPRMDSVTVAVRVRPFSQRTTTTIQDPKNPEHRKTFTFDLAYWSHDGFQKDKDGVFISTDPSSTFASQKDVFHDLGRGILDSAWQGYNATLLAYGQTGSGKSYSMVGLGANKGIIPNVCEELFQAIEERERNQEYQVTFSMLEIYNEQNMSFHPASPVLSLERPPAFAALEESTALGAIRDLLSRTKQPGGLKVREDQHLGFYVDGLKSVPCENYAQIERLMEQGTKIRTTASTNMNASSSRSHMVITIQFRQVFLDRDLTKQSTINLVDLAGSERQKSSGSEGDRLREGSQVNLSLTNLGNVISALADAATGKKVLHIPYRDSVLTKLLQPALGGNSRTTLIAAISPADICYEETLSTLRYAERAKKIRNRAVVNTSTLMRESKAENDRALLTRGNSGMAEQPARPLAEAGPWARQLEQAREEWRQHHVAVAKEQWIMKTLPHLLNVNEDPQLTGVLKYFIQLLENSICIVVTRGFPQPGPGHTQTGEGLHWMEAHVMPVGPLQTPSTFKVWGLAARESWRTPAMTLPMQAPCSCRPSAGAGSVPLPATLQHPISDKHASFTNSDGKVTVTPHSKCKVVVNGVPIVTKTKLQHLDRIILGSNSAYLYIGFPSERGSEDLTRFDYDFFQLERAAAEGVSVDKLGAASHGDGKADPGMLAVFQDYVRLMPLVAEANQMGEELKKGLRMELKVKNLAASDSRGHELQKEVMVKVTNQRTREVWIWSKAKFINRKFLMEELYQRFLDGEDSHVAQEDDPFWDPVEVVHLGSAHIWLQSLAYSMKLEEQVEFMNCEGEEEAVVHVCVTPCSPAGRACGEEDVVIDPSELLGKRMDFQVGLVRCLGVKWLKEDAERGIQMGYRMYDLSSTFYTKPVWKMVNPQIEETVQFTALNASQEFLNYLQTNALIVDLWGLQEGCAQLDCSQSDLMVTSEGHVMVDTKKMSTLMDPGQTPSTQISELYMKLLKLEQETELLRDTNRALREENVFLKQSLEKVGSTQQAHKPSNTLKLTWTAAHPPAAREMNQMYTQPASSDREFAKALKLFYHSMNQARGQLLRLKQEKPPEEDEMLRPFVQQQAQRLKDLGDVLESSLRRLKNDVAVIVKKKRASLPHAE
ncbi:kinesin-like protein KIF1C isoform X1 [Prionailurus iriomotensis]